MLSFLGSPCVGVRRNAKPERTARIRQSERVGTRRYRKNLESNHRANYQHAVWMRSQSDKTGIKINFIPHPTEARLKILQIEKARIVKRLGLKKMFVECKLFCRNVAVRVFPLRSAVLSFHIGAVYAVLAFLSYTTTFIWKQKCTWICRTRRKSSLRSSSFCFNA